MSRKHNGNLQQWYLSGGSTLVCFTELRRLGEGDSEAGAPVRDRAKGSQPFLLQTHGVANLSEVRDSPKLRTSTPKGEQTLHCVRFPHIKLHHRPGEG